MESSDNSPNSLFKSRNMISGSSHNRHNKKNNITIINNSRNNSSNNINNHNSLFLEESTSVCLPICDDLPTAKVLTLHGSAHFSNHDNHLAYRILWVFIFLFLAIIGAYWSVDTYIHWSQHPTLTTVKTTGLPIAQVDFPSITLCGQGFVSLDPILRQQFEDYVRKQDPTYTNGSAATEREWMKKLISDLYPGLDEYADLDTLIKLTLRGNPETMLKSLILTQGGYDPCLFGPVTTCPNDWLQVGNDACLKQNGSGSFGADPCPSMGAHLPRKSFLDDVKSSLSQGLLATNGADYFWLDVFHDHSSNEFKFYGDGQSLSNGSIIIIEDDSKTGDCIKAKVDPKNNSIVYVRSNCSDVSQYICEKEMMTCNNSEKAFNHKVKDSSYSKAVDMLFNPLLQKDLRASISMAKSNAKKRFRAMDKAKSFKAIFDVLWNSALPCFASEKNAYQSMIRECAWRSVPVPCSAIFNKTPTDRGMCCSFNIQAAETLANGVLERKIVKHQQADQAAIPADQQVPDWWSKTTLTPLTGRDNGLSLTLDGQWHNTPASAIDENFEGFIMMVDAKNQYPFLRRKKKLYLTPGHENLVSLSAYRIITDKSAFNYDPEVRQCYFTHEKELGVHKHYSKDNCLLECSINITISRVENKCVPWYLPYVDPEVKGMCDPWEAIKFIQIFNNISIDDECPQCLPECFETQYSASLSSAPFRKQCDLTNIGRTTFCDINFTTDRDLSIWGKDITDKYRNVLPKKYARDLDDKARAHNKQQDPYKDNIASVFIYFESPTIIEYSRETRLTVLELMGQIGGLMGLCIGMSFISVVELVYWGVYKLFRLCFAVKSQDQLFIVRSVNE